MIRKPIHPEAKFSYSVAQGSVAQRIQKCRDFNAQIYSKIREYHKVTMRNTILFDDLMDMIFSILPEKKTILIKPLNKNNSKSYAGCSDYLFGTGNSILGHIVELPSRKKSLDLVEVPTFIHEITHVFDKMLNPKIMLRTLQLERGLNKLTPVSDREIIRYNKLYDKMYGGDYEKFSNEQDKVEILRHRTQEIKKFLKGKPVSVKLGIIQNIRYQLGLELNAYTIENEYIDRMTPAGLDLSEIKTQTDRYLFKEKIEILLNMAFEIIRKERGKLRKGHIHRES